MNWRAANRGQLRRMHESICTAVTTRDRCGITLEVGERPRRHRGCSGPSSASAELPPPEPRGADTCDVCAVQANWPGHPSHMHARHVPVLAQDHTCSTRSAQPPLPTHGRRKRYTAAARSISVPMPLNAGAAPSFHVGSQASVYSSGCTDHPLKRCDMHPQTARRSAVATLPECTAQLHSVLLLCMAAPSASPQLPREVVLRWAGVC